MTKKEENLVNDILQEFKRRQEIRRPFELGWRLNMNFVIGNQFAEITPKGDIEENGRQYFWQQKEVYNHIAPIVETRLSKLSRVKPTIIVRPANGEDDSIASASLATKLVSVVLKENNMTSLLAESNYWSEITGSSFFKIAWNGEKGNIIDKKTMVKEGDVSLAICSPFEIYPEDVSIVEIDKQNSIMQAKVLTTDEVKTIFGMDVEPSEVDIMGFQSSLSLGGFKYSGATNTIVSEKSNDSVLVIEYYQKPSARYPNGRFTIIAGNKLIFDGDLPFVNGENETYSYPFVKQVCIENIGSFFGSSVVERIIPVQRAYNAVKNRKHEYMNRIAMGVLAVEDGSVDTDNLEEEGLYPGKVLVYRQGSAPPVMLNYGQVPNEFSREEEKLLSEFVMISGVSEVTTYSQVPSNVASGTAISLLLEQDDTRISLTADSVKNAVKLIGKQILRLYKQFAKVPRIKRIVGENGDVEIHAFSSQNIDSEDIAFEAVNEIEDTLSTRRAMVYDLLNFGLFADENGVMPNRTKTKIFDLLGFGNWEEGRDLDDMHIKKAQRENLMFETENCVPDIVDNHRLHIDEHTKLCVSSPCQNNAELHQKVSKHIQEHEQLMSLKSGVNALEEKFRRESDGHKE